MVLWAFLCTPFSHPPNPSSLKPYHRPFHQPFIKGSHCKMWSEVICEFRWACLMCHYKAVVQNQRMAWTVPLKPSVFVRKNIAVATLMTFWHKRMYIARQPAKVSSFTELLREARDKPLNIEDCLHRSNHKCKVWDHERLDWANGVFFLWGSLPWPGPSVIWSSKEGSLEHEVVLQNFPCAYCRSVAAACYVQWPAKETPLYSPSIIEGIFPLSSPTHHDSSSFPLQHSQTALN